MLKTSISVHVVFPVLIHLADGFQIPDILWNPKSPMFDPKLCKQESRTFFANLNDIIPIVCPNMDLNNGFKVASIKSKYNYNIFMTNDSKAYNSRNATMATKIKDCRQRTTSNGNKQDVVVVKHNERLRKYAPMDGHIYEAGKTYFFFTTSNGTEASLFNKKGKKNSMGIEVHICGEKSQVPGCNQGNRLNLCIPQDHDDGAQHQSAQHEYSPGHPEEPGTTRPSDKTESAEPEHKPIKGEKDENEYFKHPVFGLTIFLAFSLGGFVGAALVIFKRWRNRKEVNAADVENPQTDSLKMDDENANGVNFETQESTISNKSSTPLMD